MGRRRTPDPSANPAIPSSLYDGLVPGAFPYCPDDVARTGKSLGARRIWTDAVRAAGYTVPGLKDAAQTDAGYQSWLRQRERRARLIAEDPGREAFA